MNWENLDWEILDRLRATFLAEERPPGAYWHTLTDLEQYDATYGERIGWKWDAVLRELRLRGWTPPDGAGVVDWGCGSGIAGRRVVNFFGAASFSSLRLHDHSPLAVEFSVHAAQRAFPTLATAAVDRRFLAATDPIGVLVVSHVLNELDDIARAELGELLERAVTVVWVEPGTHAVSRALLDWRERARDRGFGLVAPCTHHGRCGLLAPENARHWCHHFAPPPAGIYADSDWVRFGQRAGIDLRALPYSFIVADRRAAGLDAGPGASRILGDPRFYKGYAKILNCSAAGVEELTFQQRIDRTLFKALQRAEGPLLYRWTRTGAAITGAEPLLR